MIFCIFIKLIWLRVGFGLEVTFWTYRRTWNPKCPALIRKLSLLLSWALALSLFFYFFTHKKWYFCIFYKVNNLFLHQSYLKSPLPVKLATKNANNHFLLLKKFKLPKVPSSDCLTVSLLVPVCMSQAEIFYSSNRCIRNKGMLRQVHNYQWCPSQVESLPNSLLGHFYFIFGIQGKLTRLLTCMYACM